MIKPVSGWRKVLRLVVQVLRFVFMLLLIVIPVPGGALFLRAKSVHRKNEPTMVKKNDA